MGPVSTLRQLLSLKQFLCLFFFSHLFSYDDAWFFVLRKESVQDDNKNPKLKTKTPNRYLLRLILLRILRHRHLLPPHHHQRRLCSTSPGSSSTFSLICLFCPGPTTKIFFIKLSKMPLDLDIAKTNLCHLLLSSTIRVTRVIIRNVFLTLKATFVGAGTFMFAFRWTRFITAGSTGT